jgi:hypothetical protein
MRMTVMLSGAALLLALAACQSPSGDLQNSGGGGSGVASSYDARHGMVVSPGVAASRHAPWDYPDFALDRS